MADAFSVLKYKDIVTIYSGAFKPNTGTETIVSCTATLFDAQQAIAGTPPLDMAAVTGFTPGPLTAPVAFEKFGAVPLALPNPATQDTYNLDFEAVDSNGLHYVSSQCIVIKRRGT